MNYYIFRELKYCNFDEVGVSPLGSIETLKTL